MTRLLRELLNGLLITLGILSAGMGLYGFLLSSNFIDGGVTGVSMLLAKVTPLPLSFWLPVINLPFVAIGYRHIGRAFALRSVLLKVGDVILAFNVLLFLVAMSILGVEPALYSILTYVTAARTLDFVIYGLEEYTAITIVSRQSAAIREAITSELGRGVTVYRGYGGMSGEEQDIIYCVVTRLEIGRMKGILKALDGAAFVVYHPLADAEGQGGGWGFEEDRVT